MALTNELINTVLVPLVTLRCLIVRLPAFAPFTTTPLMVMPPTAATVTNGVAAVLSALIRSVFCVAAAKVPVICASTVAPAAEKFTPYPLPAVPEVHVEVQLHGCLL